MPRIMPSFGVSEDFHALSSAQVDELLDLARVYHYRKPADAPGSTARMFYEYLQRRYDKR